MNTDVTMVRNAENIPLQLKFLFTDIDDTLTNEGQLGPLAYSSLWDLHKAGIFVIPVTGRPAGWCEMIARFWPVSGVIGENGAFYFRYQSQKMIRYFSRTEEQRKEDAILLKKIEREILEQIPQSRVSSDQFCRLFDLAIDYAEDFEKPLDSRLVQKMVEIFEKHGAQAKISSIHVNGWFGSHTKLSQTLNFLEREFQISATQAPSICGFIGDSPNDEPMWEFFPYSFGVENVSAFYQNLKHPPRYIFEGRGGYGFAKLAQRLIQGSSMPQI